MVFFSNEWCKECIKWSQFFCRARREGAMRWVMRMRSVRENKENVNNHTARWSKLLFGCVKYRKKTKTCSFSSPASRKKKNYMLKNEAIAPQLCKIIWSLSDRWLNPRACPPQAMYMIIRFTNSEIVNIPHASLSHSLTILSSLFFSIYERKLKLRGRLVWMFVTVPWLMNNLLLILSLCILFYRRSAYKYVVYSQRSQQARQQQQLPPLRYALHPNTFS